MPFLPAEMGAGSQGLRAKNTLCSGAEKEDFFRSNPKGLTLTDKLIELTLHHFFEF